MPDRYQRAAAPCCRRAQQQGQTCQRQMSPMQALPGSGRHRSPKSSLDLHVHACTFSSESAMSHRRRAGCWPAPRETNRMLSEVIRSLPNFSIQTITSDGSQTLPAPDDQHRRCAAGPLFRAGGHGPGFDAAARRNWRAARCARVRAGHRCQHYSRGRRGNVDRLCADAAGACARRSPLPPDAAHRQNSQGRFDLA